MNQASNAGWASTARGRGELAALGVFCLANLLVPLFFVDLFPFSRAPMFSDAPRQCCDFSVFAPDGRSLPPDQFALQRNYWGNPLGVGVGQAPPPTLDRFGEVPTLEAVRDHVAARLSDFPQLPYIVVEMAVIGPVDEHRVGVQARTRLTVRNPQAR